MNRSLPILFLMLAAIGLSACAGQPGIASLGAGSDSAYLNGTRGRRDAQLSSLQAEQYSRQRQQVAEEMALEQQKRQDFMQTTQGVLNIARTGLSFFR